MSQPSDGPPSDDPPTPDAQPDTAPPDADAAPRDEAPATGGGIMRRLGAGTRGASGSFGIVEQIFAPAHHDARQELERQRTVGRPAPAPTDPPELTADPGDDPDDRFRGRIVIRRPPAG